MKKIIPLLLLAVAIATCGKNKDKVEPCIFPDTINCDIEKAYTNNAAKVTITRGVWGTVSFMEGNCMPVIGPNSSCKHCAVKKMVRIYEYTKMNQATPSGNNAGFYDSFSTALIKEVDADANGFYQVTLPDGRYTIVVVENGKLYANGLDGQGGINSFTVSGNTQKINLILTYKAVF